MTGELGCFGMIFLVMTIELIVLGINERLVGN